MKLFSNRIKSDDGYAVAEFAITLPALVSVFAVCVWILGIGVTKLQLESLTSSVARSLARGEDISDQTRANAPTGFQLSIDDSAGRIRIKTSVPKEIPILHKQIEVTGYAEAISEVIDLTP